MRAALYLRMSKDTQETSIADQRSSLTEHAAACGYRIVGEYVDEGISGDATEKRKAFHRLIADATKKRFDLILCWDQDRFGRFDPIEGGFWIKPIRDAGVMLETIAQGRIDWSDFTSRLVWSVTQEGKHAYLRDLARNCCRGLRAAVEAGVYPGVAPFGYRKENKRLILGPPEEVEIVREVFRLKATGMGYRTIAVHLANLGKPFPRAIGRDIVGGWSANQVRYIIARRTYLGITTYGISKSRGKYNNVGETIVKPGTHPAIITQSEFDAAQRSKRNNTVHCRNGTYVGALAGMVFCGQCGSVMYRFKYKDEYGYVCGTYHRSKGCGFCRIMDRDLMPAVAMAIREVVGRSVPKLTAAIEAEHRKAETGKRRVELKQRLTELDASIERAAERMLSVPDGSVAVVRRKLADLQHQRDMAAEQLAGLAPERRVDAKKVAGQLVALPDLIASTAASPEIIRAAVTDSIHRVDIFFVQLDKGKVRRFFEVSRLEIHYHPSVQKAVGR